MNPLTFRDGQTLKRLIGAVAGMFLFFGSPAFAQNTAVSVPYSTRIFPDDRLRGPIAPLPATAEALPPKSAPSPTLTVFMAPMLLRSSSSSRLAQLNAGVAVKNIAVPLSLTASYGYIKPSASSGHFDAVAGQLKATLHQADRYSVTGIASYSDTRKASTKTQAGLAGEYLIVTPLSIGADVRWVERKSPSGTKVNAVIPTGKAIFEIGNVNVEGDYTFKNDVDNENDYSLEVDVPIRKSASLLGIGAGKHGTLYALYIVRF